MNKPHWENQHNWWVEDFAFEVEQKNQLLLMLREHPDDKIGEIIRPLIKVMDNHINKLQKEYKKIYGTRFNLNRVRKSLD